MPLPTLTRAKAEEETLLPLTNINIGDSNSESDPTSPHGRELSGESRGQHNRSPSAQAKATSDDFSTLTPVNTAARLKTSLTHGLSLAEASARLRDQGPNELPSTPPEPLWLKFLGQFKDKLILLLLAAAGLSLFIGNKDDAFCIFIAVFLVVTVAFVQEYRSEKSMEALNNLVPNHARLIRTGTTFNVGGRTSTWPPSGLENRAHEALEDSNHASSSYAGAETQILASQLVVGDLVLFSTGDRIPADIRVTEAADLTIDESNLTGENEPVRLTAEASRPRSLNPDSEIAGSSSLEPPISPVYAPSAIGADTRSSKKTNIAYMGTLVRSGHGKGIVYATGGRTHFGTIAASVSETESPRTPLQLSMDQLGEQLSKASFAIIFIIGLVGWLQGKKFLDLLTISISLAVAAIPEGLPVIVTVTLALGVRRMAKKSALVRKMPSVETLGSVNVICSDKTGTLTMNHMTVTKIWYFGAETPIGVEVDDDSADKEPDVPVMKILRIGNIANDARLSNTSPGSASSVSVLSSTSGSGNDTPNISRWIGPPTDVALLDLLDRFKECDSRGGPRLGEIPFSSERKWMGVTISNDLGISGTSDKELAFIKGAVSKILDRCDMYVGKNGREAVLDESKKEEALKQAEKLAEEGLRVLGFASGPTTRSSKKNSSLAPPSRTGTPSTYNSEQSMPSHDEDVYNGLTFAGLVGMSDPPRPGVSRSIARLMRGGVKVIMITGDAEATALAIAKRIGMYVATPQEHSANSNALKPVLSGHEIEEMSDEELGAAIQGTSIFARTSPDHKLKIVRALQARGNLVAMTGDGVNDAPALKKADIGVAMGLKGTDVAREAADMILTDDDFSTILTAIEEGKGIFSNIQNFLTFQLSTSAAALGLVLICTVLGFKNPLNAMQILWINVIMDGPPAQSLGVEPVDADVMNRPPRHRDDPVLTKTLLLRVLIGATLITAGTMAIYTHEMLSDGVVTKRDTTMTFTCFVLFDMFNALACRSETKSLLRGEMGLFANTGFNWAVGLSLFGQLLVIYFPALQYTFQTEALGFWDIVSLVALASIVFWADEVRKFVKGRRGRMYGSGYSQVV